VGYLYYIYYAKDRRHSEGAGHANVMTIPPNVKYKDRFLKAYKEAREKERGLWGE
jgi:hypothetical protein